MSDRKHLITKSTTAGNSRFTPIHYGRVYAGVAAQLTPEQEAEATESIEESVMYLQTLKHSEIGTTTNDVSNYSTWVGKTALKKTYTEGTGDDAVSYTSLYIKFPVTHKYVVGSIVLQNEIAGTVIRPAYGIANGKCLPLSMTSWGSAGEWVPTGTGSEAYDTTNNRILTGGQTSSQHTVLLVNHSYLNSTPYVVIEIKYTTARYTTLLEDYPDSSMTIAYMAGDSVKTQYGSLFNTATSNKDITLTLSQSTMQTIEQLASSVVLGTNEVVKLYPVGVECYQADEEVTVGTAQSSSGYNWMTRTVTAPKVTLTKKYKTVAAAGSRVYGDYATAVTIGAHPSSVVVKSATMNTTIKFTTAHSDGTPSYSGGTEYWRGWVDGTSVWYTTSNNSSYGTSYNHTYTDSITDYLTLTYTASTGLYTLVLTEATIHTFRSANSTSSIASSSSYGNYVVYSKTPSATKSATLGTVASGELTTTFNSYISTATSNADYLDICNKTDTVAYAMLEGIEDGDTTITVSV